MTVAIPICGARRRFLAGAAAAVAWAPMGAVAQRARIYPMLIWRDPGCGCCGAWSAVMQSSGRFATTLRNAADMDAVKQRLGVPLDLASCHTAEVDGLVIEGHVPVADVLRLLSERPDGVRGIAVPGMPLGSPGMEAPGERRAAFDVLAFRRNGARSVFAHHAERI